MSTRKRDVLGQIDRSKPTVATPAYLHGCAADVDDPAWCFVHRAFLVADRPYCWATIRPNGDPLHVADDVPPARPTVDERWMVVFWIALALGFLVVLAVGAYLIGLRPAHG